MARLLETVCVHDNSVITVVGLMMECIVLSVVDTLYCSYALPTVE